MMLLVDKDESFGMFLNVQITMAIMMMVSIYIGCTVTNNYFLIDDDDRYDYRIAVQSLPITNPLILFSIEPYYQEIMNEYFVEMVDRITGRVFSLTNSQSLTCYSLR